MCGSRACPDERGFRAKTLGDLLFAGEAKRAVPEEEWAALVQSTAAGDQRALQVLFERTHRIVFTIIMRITANRKTAGELTVDVFHDVWRRASAYSPADGSVVGWIMDQARSRAIDRQRLDQRQRRVGDAADGVLPATGDSDPHEALDLRDRGRRLQTALTLLTPDERQAIEAAYLSELTYIEVATRLDQPLGTVKARIRSGLIKLRQALGGTL